MIVSNANPRGNQPYYLMPHLLGQGPDLSTAEFPYNLIFRISYETDETALRAILPPQMDFIGDPMVSFMYRHSKHVEWIHGGELNAVGMSVNVKFTGEEDEATGTYWPALWEQDFIAVMLGREIFGAPKLLADINNPLCVDGYWRALVSEIGRPLLQMKFRKGDPIKGKPLEAIRQQALDARVICWKHIPTPDMKGAEISHATLYQSPNVMEKAWAGEGDVTLHELDPSVNVWSAHVMAGLRSIPLIKCTGAAMTEGSGVHKISEGKSLK